MISEPLMFQPHCYACCALMIALIVHLKKGNNVAFRRIAHIAKYAENNLKRRYLVVYIYMQHTELTNEFSDEHMQNYALKQPTSKLAETLKVKTVSIKVHECFSILQKNTKFSIQS